MPPANNANQNPYDFLLDPKPKSRPNILKSNSLKQRVLVVAGFGLLLVIIIVVLASILIGKSPAISDLTAVAQKQQALISVATVANPKTSQVATQNLSINIKVSLVTEQNQLLSYLKSQGHNLTSQDLASTSTSVALKDLSAAEQTGTVDSSYAQIAQSELGSYAQTLKQAYTSAQNNIQKNFLKIDYQDAQKLLDEVNTATQSIGST